MGLAAVSNALLPGGDWRPGGGLPYLVGSKSFCLSLLKDKVGLGIRVVSQVPLLPLLIMGVWTNYQTLRPPFSLL